MKWYFMDLLACPVCKASGDKLLLHPIEVVEEEVEIQVERIRCRDYCAYLRKPASEVDLETCRKCVKKRIVTGIIICTNCGRWYPIIDGIPVMLDDEYRDMKVYRLFYKKYMDRVPEEIKETLKIPSLHELAQEP